MHGLAPVVSEAREEVNVEVRDGLAAYLALVNAKREAVRGQDLGKTPGDRLDSAKKRADLRDRQLGQSRCVDSRDDHGMAGSLGVDIQKSEGVVVFLDNLGV